MLKFGRHVRLAAAELLTDVVSLFSLDIPLNYIFLDLWVSRHQNLPSEKNNPACQRLHRGSQNTCATLSGFVCEKGREHLDFRAVKVQKLGVASYVLNFVWDQLLALKFLG